MESSAEFCTLIGGTIIAGVAFLAGAKPLISWLTKLITERGNDNPK